MVQPSRILPYGPKYKSADDYVFSLLAFITGSELHQALCGGVHILDFLTRDPDLYSSLIPEDWRLWFADVSIDDILDLLLRERIDKFNDGGCTWRGHPFPPMALLEFIEQVRDLNLDRSFEETAEHPLEKLDRQIAIGMSVKKEHEVSHFAAFVSSLTESLATKSSSESGHEITHLVDFGSGQNYLGRVLAGPKHQKHVVALECRSQNIRVARKMDVHAKLAKKPVIWRNKKMWVSTGKDTAEEERLAALHNEGLNVVLDVELMNGSSEKPLNGKDPFGSKISDEVERRIKYVEHSIQDGDLSRVNCEIKNTSIDESSDNSGAELELLVMSLHSCGNLVHHGLRSLILNPEVKSVAMIGCCYNLCTERLGPPTYKLPTLHLRSANQRLTDTSLTSDPHGFPMSQRFLKYQNVREPGIRLNITARMMAVQAPSNWTKEECDNFFTRHFYRALIQRIFLDTRFINPPIAADEEFGGTVRGWVGGTEPIIIGSLTKSCYKSFVAYVRGAVRKICNINPDQGRKLVECFQDLTDEAIDNYERRYEHRRHDLCILWSLMAFASQLVECAIVSDRLQFLMEQKEVGQAWVQTVFDYRVSPRNLAIIGVKK